jgi:hypothetical protein
MYCLCIQYSPTFSNASIPGPLSRDTRIQGPFAKQTTSAHVQFTELVPVQAQIQTPHAGEHLQVAVLASATSAPAELGFAAAAGLPLE